MNLPGFDAERSLGLNTSTYQGTGFDRFPAEAGRVVSQFGISSDPDLGSYLRCRANGGSDLICRFFGGLPPFTIGGRLLGR
jgi:hypothetical protein